MEDRIPVATEYGPLWVTPTLLALWKRYGWPEPADLKRMVDGQAQGNE